MTDPVGPTIPDMVSDGSPLPPPISSTFWPIPIRASSTRLAVNGANICAISPRYLSQYRADICHAASALFCSSGIILVRWKLTPFLFRRERDHDFFQGCVAAQGNPAKEADEVCRNSTYSRFGVLALSGTHTVERSCWGRGGEEAEDEEEEQEREQEQEQEEEQEEEEEEEEASKAGTNPCFIQLPRRRFKRRLVSILRLRSARRL